MANPVPVLTGFGPTLYLLTGKTYSPFVAAQIEYAGSDEFYLGFGLSDSDSVKLIDPNIATDGLYSKFTSSQQGQPSKTSYYYLSSLATLSTALRGFQLNVPANASATSSTIYVSAENKSGDQTNVALPVVVLSSTSYTGGGQGIGLPANGPPVGLTLSATNGVPDVVFSANPLNVTAVAWLDQAQAIFDVAAILYVSAGDAATLSANVWNTAYGDDAAFTLDGADLTVVGNHAEVGFVPGTDDSVSFWGPGTGFVESVTGSGGTVIENGVEVSVTGDNDVVYFEGAGDILDLTAATAGGWSELTGSGGVVNLLGASLSLLGGGFTVNALSGANAVSLYGTNGVADIVNGSGLTVTLNGTTQASVNGGSDFIWFEGGSGSTVTIDPTLTTLDTVFGAGTVDLESGGAYGIGGGALFVFQQTGEFVSLSYTQGIWDRVEDAPGVVGGTVKINASQVAVYGGNMVVDFTDSTGAGDTASINQTGNNWDSVYASGAGAADSRSCAATLIVNSADVNLFANFQTVYLNGVGTKVSIYAGYFGGSENLIGSNQTVTFNTDDNERVTGGANTLYMQSDLLDAVGGAIADTNGAWDLVFARNGNLTMIDAEASVLGGGNTIGFNTPGDVVSLYDTGEASDKVHDGHGAISLNNASCVCYQDDYVIYSGGGTNALDIASASNNALVLQGAFGDLSVTGFDSSDKIVLQKSEFADFQAFSAALSAPSDDALVLTLDAHDAVTFHGLQTGAISASQVSFV